MAFILLQLRLCVVVTFIHLSSSQSTYDDSSCGLTEQMFNRLMTVNSQLMNAVSQLQRDVAELKTGSRLKNMRGTIVTITRRFNSSFCRAKRIRRLK